MDEIVKAALAKWPNVPDCYGWLALDARGQWRLRDDRAQAAGAFNGGDPAARGDPLRHDKLLEFIARNYESDAQGRWYFQNGPQRVYVELEAAPWVWRISSDGSLTSHTGLPASYRGSWVTEDGRLYVETEHGLGLVHSLDMHLAAERIEQGHWEPLECRAAELPARFRFVLSPQAQRG